MFVVEIVLVGLVLDFSGEGVPPTISNPTTKPTAKASAKAANAYYQKQPQAHNSQQPLNQSQVLHQ